MLNHQQLAKTDGAEKGPAEGESLVAYLNRKHAVAGVNSKQVAGSGATVGKTVAKKAWHRTGETAVEKLNNQQDVDEAAAAHAKAEKAAEGLISNALILPILKQVRRSTFGENSVYSGGNGEKAFGPEFDMQLADRIAQSPRLGVREALVQRLEKRSPVNQVKPATNGLKVASRIDVNG
jgi:Rod binding domain-containing protein